MDNPPRFSLGITQLDATVQDIPLGFVPATFDEQDSDWAENRSKHRNITVTMNKLKYKAASKSKKSTSKANKKKFDDSVQPRLPKAGFKSPVSPDQLLKKRKTIMFEQDHQTVMDDDTSGRGHAVHHRSDLYHETQKNVADKGEIGVSEIQHHHHREIGVSPQSHQHKSVSSSSKQHERTSKSSLDGDEIKNYINKCFDEKMAELVTLISKIPAEVVKALKNEENKQSQDVNAANKDAGHEDDFENEDCSGLEALEDVNLTVKADVNEVKLKNQEFTDVTDGQDEVSGTVTDSIQVAVDTIIFGLSTPSTTKSMDVGASSKVTKRHWDLPDCQILPDFPDAQVWKLQASKENASAKRERNKSRILRSPYISTYGSGSKDSVDFDKEEKLKYAFDGYTINQVSPNELTIDYSQWIAVGLLKTHSAKKETDNHYRVNAFGLAELAVELSTQQDYAESIVVAKNKDSIANIIHGFYMPTGLPWYMVDEVYVPINRGKEFYWVLTVIVLKERLICVYESLSSKRKKERHIEIQKLTVMLPTYLLDNGFYDKTERTNWPSLDVYKRKIAQQTGLDCGLFVCAYAEILSEGLQVHSCGFDATSQRARYASLLWHYGQEKANEGYTSDNGDPPGPKKSVIKEIEASAIITLE
ncbi:hypothetical protein CQW23_28387 [Capsicum baccatum]|uniref:Ubiquitin-like protease family profile domain-containing protein n=1 Tax=Capsicum baccatum TaxID=33114 RepID=A0A2G2VGD2_CAPBA|nr:hypothetical protein CQW23_28387 [Capsicum baccatum]